MTPTANEILFPQADDPLSATPYKGKQAILSFRFDHWRFIEPLREIVGEWCGRSAAQICLALWAEAKGAGRPTNYSATKSWYRDKLAINPDFTYRGIVESGVNVLADAGWIQDWRQTPGVRGMQSCMRATEGLVEAVDDVIRYCGRPKPRQPRDVLILRDADGRSIPLPKTQRIERRRRQLIRLNEFMSDADISGGTACMVRISNMEPERVCRVYAEGGVWQNMLTDERRALTIEGEDVCELDFRSMHPAILYIGLDLDPPDDPYWIGDFWYRDLCKIALNTMINASSLQKAVGAIATCEMMEMYATVGSSEAYRVAHEMCRLLRIANRPIEEFFFSGAGAGLMFKEAEVAMAVMTRLAERGIVVLPVHDSFLVKVSQREVLREAMETALDMAGLGAVDIRVKHLPGWPSKRPRI